MKPMILLYWPVQDNSFQVAGWEMLGEALRLQPDESWEIQAVCFTKNSRLLLRKKPKLPLTQLHCIETECVYDAKRKAECLAELCRQIEPTVFLLCATHEGRALAPMVATYLQTGLTADCTELLLDKAGKLLQVRPAYEETLLAAIETSTLPQMATVRKGVVAPPVDFTEKNTQIIKKMVSHVGGVHLLGTEPMPTSSIAEEKILMVAGAGVQREALPVLQSYAKYLGGQLACTRKLVERGWMPQERQIGLSGTAVCADVLITVGVSGSTQFMAGIARVKKIIAINTDANAPIFSFAEHSMLLDAGEFVKVLCEQENADSD